MCSRNHVSRDYLPDSLSLQPAGFHCRGYSSHITAEMNGYAKHSANPYYFLDSFNGYICCL
ncbi:hypothetical protein D3C79_1112180 [compost metagenome]